MTVLAISKGYILSREKYQNIEPKTSKDDMRSISTYIVITGAIILLQNIDILIVKAIFSDYDVTLYASVAVIAKFALILIAILETITTPTLVDKEKTSEHRKYVMGLIGTSNIYSLLLSSHG
jgi:O-antigen/teichoic acid export membrane protein